MSKQVTKPYTEIPKDRYTAFEKELAGVINKYSRENDSNTPDFILAQYMHCCLNAFTLASRAREQWYGKELKI